MTWEKIKLMEVGGIEPPSGKGARSSSTCVAASFNLAVSPAETAGKKNSQPF